MTWPLDDKLVQHAVGSILERSERQEDLDQLLATFVDPGIAMRLANNNNQIVYGRRGTGKTHVLKVLQREAQESKGELPVYVDMRALGSSALWEDPGRPAFVRVSNLVKDVLAEVQTALLDYATRPTTTPTDRVLDSLSTLNDTITRSVLSEDKVVSEESSSAQNNPASSFAVEASLSPRLRFQGAIDDTNAHTMRIVREGRPLERIRFREIGEALQTVLADAGIRRLLILLDEWTAVPGELQPLLAECVKRTCFPYPRVTVKIAAVEYRCRFGVPLAQNSTLGFELTADVSASLELDEFFVYDRDVSGTLDLFAEVLFRHVATECDRYWLGDDDPRHGPRAPRALVQQFAQRRHNVPGYYLRDRFGVKDYSEFVSAFFDEHRAFVELVRAGEGVARDFMSLFQDACFDALRRRKVRVDVRGVRDVAREWYAKEKATNLDQRQSAILNKIVAEVVGRHRARSFLFEKAFEDTEIIRSLFDLRLIHLVKRGFMPSDETLGRQYNVYTLDYGTYVDALGTDRAPTSDFSVDEHGSGHVLVVPFHDERAIKRIVIPPELIALEERHLGDAPSGPARPT